VAEDENLRARLSVVARLLLAGEGAVDHRVEGACDRPPEAASSRVAAAWESFLCSSCQLQRVIGEEGHQQLRREKWEERLLPVVHSAAAGGWAWRKGEAEDPQPWAASEVPPTEASKGGCCHFRHAGAAAFAPGLMT